MGGDAKEPKRPLSAYFLFLSEKGKSVPGSGPSKAKTLTDLWKNMSNEEKAHFENQAKEAKEKYDEAMKEYKSSTAYKSYARQLDSITGKTAQNKARAKAAKAAKERAAAN